MPKFAGSYVHFVPPVKLDSGWRNKVEVVLVDSVDVLKRALDNPSSYMSMDVETSGLSPESSFVVGVSFSFDGKRGYYLPVRHLNGVSLGEDVLGLVYSRMLKASRVFMFNARFDMRFWEVAGFDMSKVKYYDVSNPVFYADTNVRMPSLKKSAQHFLGWDMTTFEEALGEQANFYYVDPAQVAFYAASDALATFQLARATLQYYQEAKAAAKLDNELMYPLMKMEDETTLIDVDHLQTTMLEVEQRLSELTREIYGHVGYSFVINSNKQLSDALQSLGLTTGQWTASGYLKTGKNFLAKLDHPVVGLLVEYKELFKSRSSYISPLMEQAKARGGRLRFSYKTTDVPTGRLASGQDEKNPYFAKANIQAIPKPHSSFYYVRPASSGGGNVLLGWEFIPIEEGASPPQGVIGKIEGYSPKLNVRKAFVADPGFIWVSADYSAIELRIPAALSGEPVWTNAFVQGEDVHRATAISLVGEENYNSEARKIAKTYNFGILYGMSEYSVAERYGMSLEEATARVQHFKKTLSVLFSWVDAHCRRARKEGVTYTYFGRPRRIKYWFSSPDPRQRAFAYRTAVNSVVQGTAADILKIALVRCWKSLFGHSNYRDDVKFRSTVHDEINLVVRENRLVEVIPILLDAMQFKVAGWQVPLVAEFKLGRSWGELFPFKFEEGQLVPETEPI